jgi:hypothetical protein
MFKTHAPWRPRTGTAVVGGERVPLSTHSRHDVASGSTDTPWVGLTLGRSDRRDPTASLDCERSCATRQAPADLSFSPTTSSSPGSPAIHSLSAPLLPHWRSSSRDPHSRLLYILYTGASPTLGAAPVACIHATVMRSTDPRPVAIRHHQRSAEPTPGRSRASPLLLVARGTAADETGPARAPAQQRPISAASASVRRRCSAIRRPTMTPAPSCSPR